MNQKEIKPITDHSTYDPGYHLRNRARNLTKAEAIHDNLTQKEGSLLDIGCSAGYITQKLLDTKLRLAHGIEMSPDPVNPGLLKDPRFKFTAGDIAELKLEHVYDVVVYAAVHHHIFGKYGKDVAMATFKKVLDACNETLIFETGSLKEPSHIYCYQEMLKYYKNDDEHMAELAEIMKDRLIAVEVITELPMYGQTRKIYKYTLKPKTTAVVCQLHSRHTGFSKIVMHPWLNSWAKSNGFELHPGTLNLLSSRIISSDHRIDVEPFDINYPLRDAQRRWPGYGPYLIPCTVGGLDSWLFRWSQAGVLDNFVGADGTFDRDYICEVVSSHYLTKELNLKDNEFVDLKVE